MASFTRAGDNFTYVTSAATTVPFTGTGVLVAIVVNKITTGTIKLIDNTGGSTANIGTIAIGATQGRYEYNLSIGSGLIVINSATEDFTIVWRKG